MSTRQRTHRGNSMTITNMTRRGFLGRANYFVQELGIALIQPNVRGSSGFGLGLAIARDIIREHGGEVEPVAGSAVDLFTRHSMEQSSSFTGTFDPLTECVIFEFYGHL